MVLNAKAHYDYDFIFILVVLLFIGLYTLIISYVKTLDLRKREVGRHNNVDGFY